MTFAFIEQHASTWPVRLMCRLLEVSPSGYYDWRSRPESARSVVNRQLLDDVQQAARPQTSLFVGATVEVGNSQ